VGNHLFVIFAVLDVSCAVNSCINHSFFTFISIINLRSQSNESTRKHSIIVDLKTCSLRGECHLHLSLLCTFVPFVHLVYVQVYVSASVALPMALYKYVL